ncbi:MAG: cell division protein ZapA, partial [Oscillospiraceae bacterium]
MTDNKVQLNIAGISITVNTPEDKEYTAGLAEELDSDIRAILKANEGASVTSAALLCAIDYLNNERKSAKSSSNMRTQIKEYLADAASAKLECDEEHKRNLELSAEIQT